MIPQVEKLLEQARKGVKLSPRDRRRCLEFLMIMEPGHTGAELGELFGVSNRMIRFDQTAIRGEKAKTLRDQDVGLIIADIEICFDRQSNDLEKSKLKAKPGSSVYLNHCVSIMDMNLKRVKALSDLGILPKNLGNLTVTKFAYSATVAIDTSRPQRPVNMSLDELPLLEAAFEEVPPEVQSVQLEKGTND